MIFESQYPLSAYQDISPVCDKGHVMLVRNEIDGQLYIKKYLQCYNPEVYLQLQKHPVKNTPIIYGIYEPGQETSSFHERNLIVIEEYVAGSTLTDMLEEGHIFSEKETIEIALKLCEVLMDLHGMAPAVIHRDIKPSNIMVSSDGELKLLDFDAAKAGNSNKNKDTVLLGTAGFAAPEQYGFSPSSPQTDIYAVGVLMNLLLTRRLPVEKLADGKIKRVICCCLEVNPKDRYRNVGELYRALKRLCQIKAEWLPPGFRTMTPWKMLLAGAAYVIFTVLLFTATDETFDTRVELICYRIGMLLIIYTVIFFFANYMNIRRLFPLMRSQRMSLRLLGFVLAPVIISWLYFIFITLIEVFIIT